MYLYIVRFFKFLFPILGKASVQIAADTLSRIACPQPEYKLAQRRGYTSYNRSAFRPPVPDVAYYSAEKRKSESLFKKAVDNGETGDFHDVLMVAFDLKGPNAENVHQWLMDNMPRPGDHGEVGEVNLDTWWIANDERFDGSDTDSAVFVNKGDQDSARGLLRKHGLAN